jgi:hypothetical protein
MSAAVARKAATRAACACWAMSDDKAITSMFSMRLVRSSHATMLSRDTFSSCTAALSGHVKMAMIIRSAASCVVLLHPCLCRREKCISRAQHGKRGIRAMHAFIQRWQVYILGRSLPAFTLRLYSLRVLHISFFCLCLSIEFSEIHSRTVFGLLFGPRPTPKGHREARSMKINEKMA